MLRENQNQILPGNYWNPFLLDTKKLNFCKNKWFSYQIITVLYTQSRTNSSNTIEQLGLHVKCQQCQYSKEKRPHMFEG